MDFTRCKSTFDAKFDKEGYIFLEIGLQYVRKNEMECVCVEECVCMWVYIQASRESTTHISSPEFLSCLAYTFTMYPQRKEKYYNVYQEK